MRVPLPANYVLPAAWQARVVDIDHLLQPGGELAIRFNEVEQLCDELQADGPPVEAALDRIATDFPDLFPRGEASARIIRAIFSQQPPDRWGGPLLNLRDVFEDEVRPYSSRFPRGGKTRRYRGPRPDREAANTAAVLKRLDRGFGALPNEMPLTYREIQKQLGMTGRRFHKRLEDLGKRVRLTPTADRELWVALRRPIVDDTASPPVTRRCLFCDWTFEGTDEDGARAFAEHRAAFHSSVFPTRTQAPARVARPRCGSGSCDQNSSIGVT